MRIIALTKGMETMVDDTDYEWLSRYRWRAAKHGRGYYAVMDCRIEKPDGGYRWSAREMQRVILDPDQTALSPQLHVDHWDMDTLNNQRSNLRVATRSQSGANRFGFKAASGFKGVYCNDKTPSGRNPWYVRIRFNGRLYYGRSQPDPISGAREYNRLATKFFGEFARHNIIPGDK